MKLHNTLGMKLEEFTPLNQDLVKLYTCGPTVYDYAHIGNLRSFVFEDTLRRALEFSGYKVKHVMNITDVGHLDSDADEGEDKLEAGAKRENKSVWDVAEHYITAFKKDVESLNILTPNGYTGEHGPYARATDFIAEQVSMVGILLEKGYAYITEQAIYFDTSKLEDYGMLTGQKLSDKEVAARPDVITDYNKHHPQDFAIWFFKVGRFANHSMSWESPWGEGFPGWHLECSAIVHATLREPIDIHTGGVDHIGTHHTNEIAQTEAAFSEELAKFWLHNEHLLVNGAKMSKSAGNFLTLSDITERGYEPLALRLLFLQSHYRTQTNFTWEALDAAQSFLKRLQAWADLKFQDKAYSMDAQNYQAVLKKIKLSIASDLNTAEALGWLPGLIAESDERGVDRTNIQALLEELDKIFGFSLSKRPDLDEESKKLIEQRQHARAEKNWQLSDEIRDELIKRGVELKDTQSGQLWQRI